MSTMDFSLEKESGALGALFQTVVNEMKTSYPCWEDLGQKAVKLSHQLKTTISAVNQFLDALQRVADVATNAKGSTRDIGTALTRICMRHRSIENRIKSLSSSLLDCLVQPIQDKSEDWKQKVCHLEKEHGKEFKKNRGDIKKRATDTARLKKRVKKGESRMQPMLDSAVQEVNDRYLVLIESERKMVRKVLTEQRAQFCYFVSWFKPVLDMELGLLEEVSQMQDVTELLCKHAAEPYVLPPSSEAVIYDVKGLEHTWNQAIRSPPSSPSSLGSRKSSFCSLSSADSSNQPLNMPHQRLYAVPKNAQNSNQRVKNMQPWMMREQQAPTSPRFSSLSSQDSGFVASQQDAIYASRKQLTHSDEDDASTPGSLEGAGGVDPNSQNSTPSPSPSEAFYAPVKQRNGTGHSQQNSPQHVIQRPHTISAAFDGRVQRNRPSLVDSGLLPPPPRQVMATNQQDQPPPRPGYLGVQRCVSQVVAQKLPSRGRRTTPMQTPTPTIPPTIPDFHANQPDQIVPQPVYANVKDLAQHRAIMTEGGTLIKGQRNRRPLSFVGDEESIHRFLEEDARLQCKMYEDQAPLSSRSSEATIVGDDEVTRQCIYQADQLTLDMESGEETSVFSIEPDSDDQENIPAYCTLPRVRFRNRIGSGTARPQTLPVVPETAENTPERLKQEEVYASGASVSSFGSGSGVSRRHSSMSTKPPPPPVRRNSTITAATPTAPAVDFVRSNSRCTTPVDEEYGPPLHQQWANMNNGHPPIQLINAHDYMSPSRLRRPPSLERISQNNEYRESNIIYQHVGHKGGPQVDIIQQRFRAGSEPPAPQPDSSGFSLAHETMLMEIRSGVPLKKAPIINDRSKPKV